MRTLGRRKLVQRTVQFGVIAAYGLGTYLNWAFGVAVLAVLVVLAVVVWFCRALSPAVIGGIAGSVTIAATAIGSDHTVTGLVTAILGAAIATLVRVRWIAPRFESRQRRTTESAVNEFGSATAP